MLVRTRRKKLFSQPIAALRAWEGGRNEKYMSNPLKICAPFIKDFTSRILSKGNDYSHIQVSNVIKLLILTKIIRENINAQCKNMGLFLFLTFIFLQQACVVFLPRKNKFDLFGKVWGKYNSNAKITKKENKQKQESVQERQKHPTQVLLQIRDVLPRHNICKRDFKSVQPFFI